MKTKVFSAVGSQAESCRAHMVTERELVAWWMEDSPMSFSGSKVGR